MDDVDVQLYYEENRQNLIALNKEIVNLQKAVLEQTKTYVPPKDEMVVSGKVEVNTQKTVEVNNLELIKDWLNELGDTVKSAIDSQVPVTELTIKNIGDAKQKEVKITNLPDFAKSFAELKKSIVDNQPIINVTKQEVVFPINANKAIPVRLSDGKSFYNAITTAISNVGTPPALINRDFDQIEIISYNANNDPTLVHYNKNGTTVIVLIILYDSSNRIVKVTRT